MICKQHWQRHSVIVQCWLTSPRGDWRLVLVAATNYLEQLDPAMVRDGRFDFRIEIPYPDAPARRAILISLLQRYQIRAQDRTVDQVVALWERRYLLTDG